MRLGFFNISDDFGMTKGLNQKEVKDSLRLSEDN